MGSIGRPRNGPGPTTTAQRRPGDLTTLPSVSTAAERFGSAVGRVSTESLSAWESSISARHGGREERRAGLERPLAVALAWAYGTWLAREAGIDAGQTSRDDHRPGGDGFAKRCPIEDRRFLPSGCGNAGAATIAGPSAQLSAGVARCPVAASPGASNP
jgi:hypothetical protein